MPPEDNATLEPSIESPAYSKDGVDVTLIRWMLTLTPAERLEVLQQHVISVLRIRAENSD